MDDAKAEELARASRGLARDARAAIKATERAADEAREAIAGLDGRVSGRLDSHERRLELLEARRGLSHRFLDLVSASTVLQASLAFAILLTVAAVGLVYSPSLLAALPFLPGASHAP